MKILFLFIATALSGEFLDCRYWNLGLIIAEIDELPHGRNALQYFNAPRVLYDFTAHIDNMFTQEICRRHYYWHRYDYRSQYGSNYYILNTLFRYVFHKNLIMCKLAGQYPLDSQIYTGCFACLIAFCNPNKEEIEAWLEFADKRFTSISDHHWKEPNLVFRENKFQLKFNNILDMLFKKKSQSTRKPREHVMLQSTFILNSSKHLSTWMKHVRNKLDFWQLCISSPEKDEWNHNKYPILYKRNRKIHSTRILTYLRTFIS